MPKLVALDTYLLNWDRRSPNGSRRNKDNVFLSQERAPSGQVCLMAIDHSHAISHGREIDVFLGHIDRTKEEQVYGLFEPFAPYITEEPTREAVASIGRITDAQIGEIIAELPREWEVGPAGTRALRTFLTGRRAYLVSTFYDRLSPLVGPKQSADG